jgi:hypothetical protein
MARFTHPGISDGTGISQLNPFHGSFYSLTTQTLSTTSQIKAWKFEITDLSQGVTIENNLSGDPTQITFENAGVYNIQFSTQLYNTGGGGANSACDIWLAKNGFTVDATNTKVAVNANSPYVVASWNFFVTAEAGEYYELLWKTTHTGIQVYHTAVNGSVPEIPSIILTVTQVA